MNPFIALRDHAKEVYDTLSGNERIKERTRGLYDQVVNRGIKPSFPMLLKDPQNVTMDDLIASGFGVMPMAIKAYHGSPHMFDKFDMANMGNGEGAQSYGHGLYMAESPDVARTYIDASRNGESGLPAHVAYMKAANYPKDEIKMFEDAISNPNEKASFYETSLQWPDPAREAADPMGPQHFLDWDRPLSEQTDFVKNILKNENIQTNKSNIQTSRNENKFAEHNESKPSSLYEILGGNRKDATVGLAKAKLPEMIIKGDIYKDAPDDVNLDSLVSSYFNKLGIPGIRYLDQGSRGAGQGSYNYVVFDDSIPKIVKRNGKSIK